MHKAIMVYKKAANVEYQAYKKETKQADNARFAKQRSDIDSRTTAFQSQEKLYTTLTTTSSSLKFQRLKSYQKIDQLVLLTFGVKLYIFPEKSSPCAKSGYLLALEFILA